MRAVREIRPPGVYPAAEEMRAKPLTVADTRVAGFVGLAARGPLDEPVLLGGWNEFLDVYGHANDSYLARAVEGFFLNGGSSCYVVRIAHRARDGAQPGPEHAACAERVVKDGWDKPTLRIASKNEGRWGNNIWVRFQQTTAAKTLLTLDLEVGSGEARVNSVKGFERGALVRVYDRENSDYVIVTEVEDRTIRWASATPLVRRYRAAGPTYLEVMEFEVFASLKDRREVFRGLQMSPLSRRYAPRIINDESQLVRLTDLSSVAPLPHNLPQAEPAAKLVGGRDGVDVLSPEDFVGYDHGPDDRTGLEALGAVEQVAILSVPDIMIAYKRTPGPQADRDVQRVHDAMIDQCERLQDRFAILDAPPTKDVEEVRKWRRRLTSSYAALYYPWITIDSAGSVFSLCPPSGHVAGIYARCDRSEGVHKAPANEVIKGAAGLMLNMNEDHLGLLNSDGINAVRALPGRGIRLWGARTTSEDPDWRQINVRRIFIMLRRSLEEGTQWVVFENNEPLTWERLTRDVDSFLKNLWEQGYFAGVEPEESYFARCNAETNPREVREAGQMVMEIGVAPVIPAEYIIFNVVQKMGDHAPQQAE
ncbi:MAG TPA: phage tail sheath subtilisin-like domain-containing protein [Polyangia bacterium]|nr:phage tail sheath subtilisin-like domain-containing protein [Polyangia bacterium]